MGHINFHSLAAPERKKHERTFTDPAHPGLELLLVLEEPDALTDYLAAEVSGELVKRYIEGDAELQMPAQPFMVGDEARTLSPLLCDDVGRVVAMQPAGWTDAYQPEEVLQMAFKARGLWLQVRRWARELYRGAQEQLPNASGTPGADSCVPPSTAAPSIPVSSPISAKPSSLSTSGSAVVTG